MRAVPALLLLAAVVGCSGMTPDPPALPAPRPIVIAHRGASGYRPEHTLEAYRLAIVMGADFIEPDLVPTRDGVLVARHESRIDDTTDIVEVVARGDLPDRKATKVIDGDEVTGYFTEDYTLAELRQVRARERIPKDRPQCAAYDGRYTIPTLADVIALVRSLEKETGLRIGIYPETKHPTFFLEEGRHADGSRIGMDLGGMLVDTLVEEGFTDPERVYIQSFEFSNLIRLHRETMPARGVRFPLAQLYGDVSSPSPHRASFSRPYDMTFNARQGRDLRAIYGGLADLVPIRETTGYGDLVTPAVFRHLGREYASAIAPWKHNLLVDEPTREAIRAARAAGLGVHPYTFRTEDRFLSLESRGRKAGVTREILELLDLGVTGFFTDFPDQGRFARDLWLRGR